MKCLRLASIYLSTRQKIEKIVFVKHLMWEPVYLFSVSPWLKKVLKILFVKTHHIGINLPIRSLTMVEENLKIVLVKRFILVLIYLFSLSPWLKKFLKVVFVKRFILTSF